MTWARLDHWPKSCYLFLINFLKCRILYHNLIYIIGVIFFIVFILAIWFRIIICFKAFIFYTYETLPLRTLHYLLQKRRYLQQVQCVCAHFKCLTKWIFCIGTIFIRYNMMFIKCIHNVCIIMSIRAIYVVNKLNIPAGYESKILC